MNRHDAIGRVPTPADFSPDTYRLLATGRTEPSPAPNGLKPLVATPRPEDAAAARHGSVYLPHWRFGSRRRRRRTPSGTAA